MTANAATHTAGAQVTVPRDRMVDAGNIVTLAVKEIRDSLNNRWFILYTIAFAVLATALAYLSMMGTGSDGFAGFGRTAAGLINLVLLIVPLMALTAGAGAIASERERGTLSYLLAQPVTRFEVLIGKYIGLALTMMAALALGFGISAAVIASRSGGTNAVTFLSLVGYALILALGMLSLGFLLSVIARKTSVATGAAIFLWLAFVFLGDLGLMGSAVVFRMQVTELFHLALINPLQVFKMASLDSMNASLDVLGPAGLYASQQYGNGLPWIFGSVLALWVVVPLAISYVIFARRGVS